MILQCLSCSARATYAFFVSGFTTDFRAEMRALKLPAPVIHGDKDRQALIYLCGRKSAELVPNNRFLVYENAAHGMFITHADRLNADLLEFVNG